MRVLIDGQPAVLDDADVLGQGGEAVVYRHGGLAVKIFHPDADAVAKHAKLAAFPRDLPAGVVGPSGLVTDVGRRRRPIGYAMPRVSGGLDLSRLALRKVRDGVIDAATVLAIFTDLHASLRALHERGVVVGDLNDGNVLAVGRSARLIDVDSLQFGDHLCTVAHERFLDPRLYGVDLSAAPAFDSGSDWYAFTILVFQTLLYVHPFGGVHPTEASPLRRAELGLSVLRDEVKRPKVAASPTVLPDPLRAWFEAVLERGVRDVFPERLLSARGWTRCPSCGLEHARMACPSCASTGHLVLRPPAEHHGRCRATTVFRTHGRILSASWDGGLRYAWEADGVVRREDGSPVYADPIEPGLRFGLAARATWVGSGRRLVAVCGGRPGLRVACSSFAGAPSFAVAGERLIVAEGGWLKDASQGLRLGSVLDGQTWFAAGPRLGAGHYRAGAVTQHFLFRPDRPGLVPVELPPIEGRLLDVDACFDDGHALIGWATERRGRAHAHLALVRADGRVLGRAEGDPREQPHLAVGGKALMRGRAVATTDRGLVALVVEAGSGALGVGDLFVDTAPFVAAGHQLLPGPGGSVHIVTTREIIQLALN